MELRDPYLEDHAEQRRQAVQQRTCRERVEAHAAQGNRPQRGSAPLQNVQQYRLQREGVQVQDLQPRRLRGESVQPQSAQARRPQGEGSGPRDIQLYVPQRESARPQRGQGCASRGSARVCAAQGYRPQMESVRGKDVQVYRPQGSARACTVQARTVQGSRPQMESVRGKDVRVYRPQRSAQGHDVQDRRAAALRRRKRVRRQILKIVSMTLVFAVLGCMLLVKGYQVLAAEPKPHEIPHRDSSGLADRGGLVQGIPAAEFAKRPEMEENFLTPNEYSRPGEALPEVKNIFVHYTANPGTSAAQNRNYFEQQKDSHENSVSAHFIIGCEGEIIQCVPLNEIAYAVSGRNYDSVSIECCHKTEDGSFTRETYDSLIGLLAWLTDVYDLDSEDILRHYDSNGKLCPLYYTEHPEAWEQLKEDVETFRKRPSKETSRRNPSSSYNS